MILLTKEMNNIFRIADDLITHADSLVNIELEARVSVPSCKVLFAKKASQVVKRVITYYKSSRYPGLTFRSYDDAPGKIETKETVTSYAGDNNVSIVLSVEQSYTRNEFTYALVPYFTRTIERVSLLGEPREYVVELTRFVDTNTYTLEIEFSSAVIKSFHSVHSSHKLYSLVNTYKPTWWPSFKPIDIEATDLAYKLRNLKEWSFSIKADGQHCMLIIESPTHRTPKLLFDNGDFLGDSEVDWSVLPYAVLEAEFIGDKVLVYDCVIFDYTELRTSLLLRRRYIDRVIRDIVWDIRCIKKEILTGVTHLSQLRAFLYEVPPFNSDGWVITSVGSRGKHTVYKSKHRSTVDLLFSGGMLLLKNENTSDRIAKFLGGVNGCIYEVDTKTLAYERQRKDKTEPNATFPVDDNQLYKIVFGVGTPSTRVYYEKLIELYLLQFISSTSNVLIIYDNGVVRNRRHLVASTKKAVIFMTPTVMIDSDHWCWQVCSQVIIVLTHHERFTGFACEPKTLKPYKPFYGTSQEIEQQQSLISYLFQL
jgi:hypothetical protein